MESISSVCCDSIKRYWRRRRYQRLGRGSNNKRKLKIIRLGGAATRRLWKLRTTPKLQWKLVSPIRLLINFHEAYVEMMIRVANSMGKLNNKGWLGGNKKVAKEKEISMVCCGEEVIDTRLVVEIYKRLAASRQLRGY
ncbi:hypothetical protein P3X46_022987 [Hevea brasiliensis]|uniref:Uncharacterized protein n=1 Tax=Hevea brasiliensis TaxID=3981 RepID=A0ABQ9LBG5_HEVBR|nr:hypothetical protein P3X46_022987 [Hevea brasiliensis]